MVGFVRAHFAALCCPCLLYDASQCLLNGLTNEDQIFGVIWTQLLNQKFLNNGLEAKGTERLGNHPPTVRTTSSMLRELTHIMSKIKLRLRKLSGCYASEHPHLRPKGPHSYYDSSDKNFCCVLQLLTYEANNQRYTVCREIGCDE